MPMLATQYMEISRVLFRMFLERKSASTRLPKKMIYVIEEARACYRSKVDESLGTRTAKTDRAEAD